MITTHVLPALRPHVTEIELHEHVRRGVTWLREACCGLHGHDLLLHFEKSRLCLKCAGCGFETPGWRIERMKHA
jgi:hypothetical protein